ncbi:MAG: hypothetical protein RIT45_1865 [Pseudomonadota bacterium]|jgi:hypothetical protein
MIDRPSHRSASVRRRLLAAAMVASAATACTEARGGRGPEPQEQTGAGLSARGFVLLTVSAHDDALRIERVAEGSLTSLALRERRRVLGVDVPARKDGALCARRLDGERESTTGRCVAWRGAHLAPGPHSPGGHADRRDAVAIRLAAPATGTAWILRDDAGREARWP